MDSELVSSSLSATRGSEQVCSAPSFTYTEKFYELFPYYLSIGMTYDQYWNDDPSLVKYYRKADEMRKERINEELWLQGMYVYEALCDVSPILHAFAKKGTKPHPYSERPYAITESQHKREKEEKERKHLEKCKRYMEALMSSNNKKFEGGNSCQVIKRG